MHRRQHARPARPSALCFVHGALVPSSRRWRGSRATYPPRRPQSEWGGGQCQSDLNQFRVHLNQRQSPPTHGSCLAARRQQSHATTPRLCASAVLEHGHRSTAVRPSICPCCIFFAHDDVVAPLQPPSAARPQPTAPLFCPNHLSRLPPPEHTTLTDCSFACFVRTTVPASRARCLV